MITSIPGEITIFVLITCLLEIYICLRMCIFLFASSLTFIIPFHCTRVWDRLASGHIPVEQLRHIMTNMGEKLSEDDMEDMMSLVELDDRGEVKYRGKWGWHEGHGCCLVMWKVSRNSHLNFGNYQSVYKIVVMIELWVFFWKGHKGLFLWHCPGNNGLIQVSME